MNAETVKEFVKKIVDEALSDKERSAAVEGLNTLLAEAANKLEAATVSLQEKTALLDEQCAEIEQLRASVATEAASREELTEKLQTTEAELAEKAAFLVTKEQELASAIAVSDAVSVELSAIKELRAQAELAARLEVRVAELTEARVLRSGAALDEQKNRVVGMSDEEFVAYKTDLVVLRDEFLNAEQASKLPPQPRLDIEGGLKGIREKYQAFGQALAESAASKRAKPE